MQPNRGPFKRADQAEPQPDRQPASPPAPPAWIERQGYQPPASSRWFGIGGTAAIFALMLAGFFLAVTQFTPTRAPSALTVVNLRTDASPPETSPAEKEAPQPAERNDDSIPPPKVNPLPPPRIPAEAVAIPIPAATPPLVDPAPREPETAAPKTMPAPPAPKLASSGPDSWEGRVLAQLNKHRRYPRAAMARRQQGVPYIRFVMDRQGKLLSCRLERSSGFPDLDREAVALARRASPLPPPPNEKRGDTLELVVPVEFFLR